MLLSEEVAIHHQLCLVMETDALDLVIWNRAPAELTYAVIAQGVMLFQLDLAMRVEFEGDILSRFSDELPRPREQRKEMLQRGWGEN